MIGRLGNDANPTEVQNLMEKCNALTVRLAELSKKREESI